MSKQIEERVVEMRFDNSQFEKNASQTLSTLEKLKQSLNLTGAAKGFEDIGAAAKKIDMSGMANGVEAVGLKFNALYSIADQTLRNITTRVQNAAEQWVKSLTIQPITTGFNEYELKMGSIQTIMASTGESLATVNKYLNELNEYSDRTIYSFSDMTQNIGKFTNAGVKLEDAVLAIKGISNEAAVSGANANEASRAMYNFAQALSAGYVKLIDWKSIENANMATVEFKNYLLEAAAAAGTLEKQTNGMYKVLSTNAQGSTFDEMIDATTYFNDSLNYQWMTTEALVSTLKAYADETTDIGKKAYASAQDIKTFTQMMDTLKESAQSGWASTWEIIIGDFETAKKTWTTVGEVLGNIINDMSDARNSLIKGAFTSNWDSLVEEITKAGISVNEFEESMRNVLKAHGKDVDALIKQHGSLEQVFRKESWGAEYLKEALHGIKSELVDLSDVEDGLKFGSSGEDVKKIQKALKDAGYQCGEFGEALDGIDGKLGKVTESSIKAFQKAQGLAETGIIDADTLKALEAANKKTKALDKSIDKLIDSIDELGGRELLVESLKNIFNVMKDIIEAVGAAWDNVFSDFESADLYRLIERFHDFTEELTLNTDTTNDIIKTFEGLFQILKIVKDVIASVVSTGAKLVWSVFKPLATTVLSATAALGKFIRNNSDVVYTVFEPIGKIISGIIDIIGKLAETIGSTVVDSIRKLSELEFIKTVGDWFHSGAEAISGGLAAIASYIESFDIGNISVSFERLERFFNTVNSVWGNFKNSAAGMELVDNITAPFNSLWDWVTSFEFPKLNLEKMATSLNKYFDFLKTNDYVGIFGSVKGTLVYLKNQLSYRWDNFQNDALIKFSEFYLEYGDSIKAGFEKAKEIMATIVEFIFGTKELTVGDILELAEKFLTVAILIKTLNIVKDISGALDSVADAFENIGAGIKWRAVGVAFLSIGAALAAFAICMKIVETMDAETASRSLRTLLTALTVMGLIVGGLLLLSSKVTGGVNLVAVTASMVGIAISLGMLVYALKEIDAADFSDLRSSFGILTGVLLALFATMWVLGKTCGGANLKTAAALLTFMTALKMTLDVLESYAEYDWDAVKSAIPKMAAVLLGLAVVLRVATGGIKEGANVSGTAFLVLAMVLSLKLLVEAIAELGNLPISQLDQGLYAISYVMTALTIMLGVINLTSKTTVIEKGQKGVNGFAGLAAALLSVAVTISILGSLPIATLKQGGAAVTLILGLFTAMLAILGKSMSGVTGFGKITGMIIGMGLIIAELAVVLYLLRDIDGSDAVAKFGGISAVLVAMAVCMKTMTALSPRWGDLGKWVVAMLALSGIVAALAAVLAGLEHFDVNGSNAVAQFGAISLMLVTMAGVMKILTSYGGFQPAGISKWVVAMGEFALVVAALAVILVGLEHCNVDGSNAVSQFGAISILLVAMSACIRILATMSPIGIAAATAALKPLGALAIGLAAFLGIIGGIDLWSGGKVGEAFDKAVEIVSDIGRALGGLAGGILEGLGKGLTAALPQMGKDLSDFMDSAGVFFAGLSGMDASMVTNTAIMVASIGELGVLASTNGFDNIFTKGRSLPNLGSDLSTFMTNASGFFSGLSSVDTGMATSVKAIAEAIAILAEASKTDTLTFGDGFASLGSKLVPFGQDMVAFSDTISGKIDAEAIEATAAAAGVMATLNASLPKEYGAISGLFKSEPIPLDTFGAQLVSFGKAIVAFSGVVKGNVDADAIAAARDAGAMMAELNASLPKEYGAIAGLFTSEVMSIDSFGAQLVGFGRAMMSFSSIVSQGDIDSNAVEAAASAGAIMAELGKNLPTEYGAITALFANNTVAMDEFGAQLVMFGRAIVGFSNTVKGNIDQTAIESAASAGNIMSEMAKTLPDDPSLFDKWFGSNNTMDMAAFGEQLVEFGKAVVSFSESVSGTVDTTAITTAVSVAEDMVKMANSLPEEMDLTVLKTGLIDLGEAMKTFSEAVSGKVDNETISVVVTAAKTLAQAASIMPDEVNLARLTIGLSDFGSAIVSFSNQVSGVVDGGSIAAATTAGVDIAKMMATIPQGVDPTVFITNLSKLGEALVEFSNSVSGDNGLDTDALYDAQIACGYIGTMLTSLSMYSDITEFINNSKLLAQAIVDFSKTVSAEDAINSEAIIAAADAGTRIGYMLANIAVYTDLTEFISNSKLLAQAIVNFSKTVAADGAINSEAITNATNAGLQIANMLNTVPAYVDIGDFVTSTAALAQAIIDFSTKAGTGIDANAIGDAHTAAIRIKNVVSVLSSITDISGTVSLVGELGNAISTFSNTVAEADMTGLSDNSAVFKKTVESFGNLSKSGIEAFIKNLSDGKSKTVAAVSTFCQSVVTAIASYGWSFKDAGAHLVAGFVAGITQNTFKAKAAARAMALAALNAAKAALDEHSPSREFYKVGAYAGEGFVNAFSDYKTTSANAGSEIAKSALTGLRDAITTAQDLVENGIDAQPTIRPVLDLSDLKANASSINSLFDMKPSIGVLANVGAISNGMAVSQNGSTFDVVTAIDKLGEKIDNVSGDTYNVNGITYSEGSELAEAIQTIVRHAKIERRV